MDKPALIKLSHHVENEYLAFHNELSKLEVLEYPTKACEELISLLDKLVSKKIKTIEQIRKKIQQADSSINLDDEKDNIIIEREKLFEIFAKFLDWISGAPTQKVPWSLIPSVERLAEEIIPDYAAIVYCQNLYNYGIQWPNGMQKEFKKLKKYSFISLPRLHRINILMHTMIGHELFHPLCEEFTLQCENDVARNIAVETAKQFSGNKRLDQINKRLLFAWRRALHELMCDMASAELFGPAALLAMRTFASFSALDDMPGPHNNFYPPWQYRFEVVWQQTIRQISLNNLWTKISEGDVSEVNHFFKNDVSAFGATLSSGKGYELLEQSDYKISYKEVDKLIDDAHSFVKSKLPDSILKWHETKVVDQIPDLVNRLRAGVPPNEIVCISPDPSGKKNKWGYECEPAELPAILIAGWIYQIYREHNRTNSKNNDILSYETLSRLLLKSCEDSEMLRYQKRCS